VVGVITADLVGRERMRSDMRAAKSIIDYIFRWMGKKFLTVDQQEEVGILSPDVRAGATFSNTSES
jgi:hypothetical protein